MTTHPGQTKLEFIDGQPPGVNRRKAHGKGGGKRVYLAESQQLKEAPWRWAILRRDFGTQEAAGTLANYIKNGQLAAFRPRGFFEAVSRTVDGEFRVYARYAPGGDDESS